MTHTISDESLEGWKATFAKDGIIYKTDDEYYEAINNFVGFIEILIEIDQKQKESPSTDENDGTYFIDKNGKKIVL